MSHRLIVSGALGRMGTMVIREAGRDPRFETVQILESGEQEGSGPGTDLPPDFPPLSLQSRLTAEADVLIDFTTPAGFRERLIECVRSGIAFVSGTTGLGQAELDLLIDASSEIPVLHAPNMSLGVEVLSRAVALTASLLPEGFDAEVTEVHHGAKVDAPSGTALRILDVLRGTPGQGEGETVFGRHGKAGPRARGEIGLHAIRGGDVIGEHTVLFLGPGERVEITHRCTDRAVFARGALHAADRLAGSPPGRFSISDILRD